MEEEISESVRKFCEGVESYEVDIHQSTYWQIWDYLFEQLLFYFELEILQFTVFLKREHFLIPVL